MEKGTYTAASGGLLQLRKLDVTANNIANINTPGFKRQILVSQEQSFDETLARLVEKDDPFARGDHARTAGVSHVQALTDFTQGPIKNTSNPLDAALSKQNQFFVVNTPEGQQFTRAGNFTLSSEGTLVTQDGYEVQGDGGAISVTAPGVRIAPSGEVTTQNGSAGRIQVVTIDNPQQLVRKGDNRFALSAGQSPPQPDDTPSLVPQALEQANVSAISGVIDLITANRAFELYTKSASSIDQLDQQAISQIGRVR